jgi:hypothetical protein
MNPRTERHEPRDAKLNILKALPILLALLTEIADPKNVKSRTLKF